jgi:hypothetical protein
MLKLSQRMFLATVACVALGSACGGDDTVPLEPVSFQVSIDRVNDGSPRDVALRCDGTISVLVSIAPADTFALRPANACGSSSRCGYVHFEALTEEGDVLASADSATVEGVLRLRDLDAASTLHTLTASLRSGVDQKTLVDAAGDEVTTRLTPTFALPENCEATGAGGAGGSGNEPSQGGAGGTSDGGAGGETAEAPLGGAGAGGMAAGGAGAGGAGAGGAGAGGELSSAGAGGA